MQHRDTEALDFESGLVVGLFGKRVAVQSPVAKMSGYSVVD